MPSCRRMHRRRSGNIMVLFALLLPALLGMVGLVLDTGLIATGQKQAQAGADAAAVAAAQALLEGGDVPTAVAQAQAALEGRFGSTPVQVQVSIPPQTGPWAGRPGHAEVEISLTVATWFVRVLGAPSQQTVLARAVAGIESRTPSESVCLLDTQAVPGFAIDRGTLEIQGRAAVNSPGSGLDSQGAFIDRGAPPHAVTLGGTVQAERLRVVGGVDVPARIQPPPGSSLHPLQAGKLPAADPFLFLPTPSTDNGVLAVYPGTDGATFGTPQHVLVELVEGREVSLAPGIYASIVVTGPGPGTLTFQPGIFVLAGGDDQGRALHIQTQGTVRGAGVLFYNTGIDYQPAGGSPDLADGTDRTPAMGTFGKVSLAAEDMVLSPLPGGTGPFDGFLIYQRRRNPRSLEFTVSSTSRISGTTYARTAPCSLSGAGTWQGHLVVGTLTAALPSSEAILSILPESPAGKGPLVYLVD